MRVGRCGWVSQVGSLAATSNGSSQADLKNITMPRGIIWYIFLSHTQYRSGPWSFLISEILPDGAQCLLGQSWLNVWSKKKQIKCAVGTGLTALWGSLGLIRAILQISDTFIDWLIPSFCFCCSVLAADVCAAYWIYNFGSESPSYVDLMVTCSDFSQL